MHSVQAMALTPSSARSILGSNGEGFLGGSCFSANAEESEISRSHCRSCHAINREVRTGTIDVPPPIALGGGPGQRCPRGATRPVFLPGAPTPTRMFALAAILVAATVLAAGLDVPR